MAQWQQLIIAICSSGFLGGLITNFFNRNKVAAESDLTMSTACEKMLKAQQEVIQSLQERIEALETEVKTLRDKYEK